MIYDRLNASNQHCDLQTYPQRLVSNQNGAHALRETRAPGIRYYSYAVSLLSPAGPLRRERKVLE